MFCLEVTGRRIERIERRAKHLIFRLSSGKVLLLHLMLSGWMFYGQERQKPERNAQVALRFGAESLYFISLRLGYLHLLTLDELERALNHLGPEPLAPSFTPELCAGLIRQRRSRLKTALVDQSFISGIGNCYSDEICFAAGLLPTRHCSDLHDSEIDRLYGAIRTVLSEAVRYGGYMAHPLYIGDERTGGFDERCKVYDRGGEPCVRCGHPIVFQKVSSRKCFYCANCQR
jgi:formamidopyrimidine-DNA glycosylase